MENSVSVVVCAHNEEDYIENCLKSLLNQTYTPIKIIVVLDRCTDNTLEIVNKYPVKIIIKNKSFWRNSYSENLELARKEAKGKYFAIVDADVILSRSYFEENIPFLKNNVVAVSGMVINASIGILSSFIRAWEKTYYFSIFKTKLPAGCSLVIKKDFLDNIGGFEDLPAPDTYLHQKALEQGLTFYFNKTVKAYHCRQITLKSAMANQIQLGIRRKKQRINFWKTLLHAIFRLRPFVIIGWLKGNK